MFEKLWSMLQELENAQGAKAKNALLKKFVGASDFQWMAKMALDQGHSFGVDSLPEYEFYAPSLDYEMVGMLEELKTGRGVNDSTVNKLYQLMCSSQERYNVVLRILRKDLRCGVGAKTINKACPGLVFRLGYQRCAGAEHAHKIDFNPGAILQGKADGMFVYILPDGSFMTRKAERCFIPGNPITPYLSKLPGINDKVIAGELVVVDDNDVVMDRAKGNGLINAFFKGGGDPEVAKDIRAYCWLYLTEAEFKSGQGTTAYRYIWNNLCQMLPPLGAPIKPIQSWYVVSLEEAMQKTRELIAAGQEGTILKSMSPEFLWADEDPSYFQIKLKAEAEGEFVLIDAYEGDPKKKYAGQLGGITVRSKDGVVVSDCGGGFSDAQRKMGVPYWKEKAGAIVTIKYNGITEPNENGIRSLQHPNFIEERIDKDEADSYERLRDLILGRVQ